MGIFKQKDMVSCKSGRGHQDVINDMIAEYDGLCKRICKASGMEITDLFSELDETSGEILGACIRSSKKLLNLAVEQAAIMDRQEQKLDALTRTNEKLLRNTELLLTKK